MTWQALRQLRLQSWYAYQNITYSLSSASNDQNLQTIGGQNPRNQAALRASTSLTDSVELDGMLRYVGALNSIQIDDYIECNVRLGWHISKDLELSLLNGTDLLHANHAEGSSQYVIFVNARPERGVYGLIRYSF